MIDWPIPQLMEHDLTTTAPMALSSVVYWPNDGGFAHGPGYPKPFPVGCLNQAPWVYGLLLLDATI